MLRRLSFIENAKVLADSGEWTSDVRVRDPITALWVYFTATNGTASNKANLLADCIDQVDLLDGANVLQSLDGQELFALAAYRLGHIPLQGISEYPSTGNQYSIPLLFGRFVGDPVLAFDPTRFVNPQIRVKWNLSAVRTVAATAYATGTGRLTLLADVMEGSPAPTGMLTAKEIYAFTTAASGITYIDLPTDRPHRALLMLSHKAALGQFSGISNIKLTCDQGKFVPLDIGKYPLLYWLASQHPPFAYRHHIYAADGDTLYFLLKFCEQVSLCPVSERKYMTYAAQAMGQGGFGVSILNAAAPGTSETTCEVAGYLPHGAIYWPWGDVNDINTWFPANVYKSMRLELTNDVVSADAKVVVEQLRTY